MPEVKDPAIKLFGKTIQLSHLDHHQQQYFSGDIKKSTEHKHEDDPTTDQSTSPTINDDPKTPNPDKETPSKYTPKTKNPIKKPNPEEKPQKPDEILPCPRCNSMDTKFCYFNNYNVNQPRHFCKNCQRYWTAGGTMRNTPVGSGRRKNKSLSSASSYRHLIITDTCLNNNGGVLNFGSDVRLCDSTDQAPKFMDKLQKSEDDDSCFASILVENGGNNGCLRNLTKYPVQIPCFSSHPWNSARFQSPANLYQSGFHMNFYPMPYYWGNTKPMTIQMPLMNTNSSLGKHSRDGNLLLQSSNSGNEEPLKDKDSESLRINDSNKDAKSLVRSSIGVPEDENGSNLNLINGGIHSKAFQSKIDETNKVVGSSLASLQANPAALS
ncbi:hypothetical protein R6Q57_022156 [Mikania cordata]